MYLSQMLVDLGACMEAPCTPLAARDRLVMFSEASLLRLQCSLKEEIFQTGAPARTTAPCLFAIEKKLTEFL